ncbi:alpha-hydroxy-acid oxidizing protein [Microbacteriaceae bacterium VKM Ac-2854]|nr:alpha-hydroxy-acid oxidizing protein [Microbacteriaceae bacterium VKM Ac-2854]
MSDPRDIPSPEALRYLEGVAGDGRIAAENEEAWRRYAILPRMFRTPRVVDTRVALLGLDLAFPVLVAPSAAHGLGHPDGEVATAEGARRAGAGFVLSQAASRDVEDVAAVGPFLQQIYLPEERALIVPFLERTAAAGARALVLTLDQPGSAYQHPFRRGAIAGRGPRRPPVDYSVAGATPAVSVDLDDIAWLRDASGLPVLVKGVLHPQDAADAIDAGAAGIVVSNHGGRQIGGSISSAQALPEVVDAVAGRVPVLADSGIRSEDDVFRALALGADAALIGRPAVRALWRGGAEAVAEELTALRDAFEHLLRLAGIPDVAGITRDHLRVRA